MIEIIRLTANVRNVVLNRPKSICFRLISLECLAHEVSVLFSFRLKFPYFVCPPSPSGTVGPNVLIGSRQKSLAQPVSIVQHDPARA
jgi:hypothetical protein